MTASVTPAAPGVSTVRSVRARLVAPAAATGALMLIYLLVRPYGDAGGATSAEAAAAFASTRWVVAHLAGLLALASYAQLAVRLADHVPGPVSSMSRTLGVGGLVLTLPYFGAETFALHVLGRQARAGDTAVLELVAPIREQPVALTLFGLGLALLAASAVLFALSWSRSGTGPAWAVWPLAVCVALFLPHFFLPPVGRMLFGVLYAVACLVLLVGLRAGSAESGAS